MRILFAIIFVCGCRAGIDPGDYSPLTTPEEAYQFARTAVAKDDPEAFYYCLTPKTRQKFSLSEMKLGWALAGSYFYIFLDAKLKDPDGIQTPAPGLGPDTAKATLVFKNMEASFLLEKEDERWRLAYPSPYPLPDIQGLKVKQRTPWRTAGRPHYQTTPEAWYPSDATYPPPIEPPPRDLPWRAQGTPHYRVLPEQWRGSKSGDGA